MHTEFRWIPEAPNHRSCYAAANEASGNATHSVYEARQFATEAECRAWCDAYNAAHPEVGGGGPAWVPREHGFLAAGA